MEIYASPARLTKGVASQGRPPELPLELYAFWAVHCVMESNPFWNACSGNILDSGLVVLIDC
jgi:hypothetical protein